MVLESLATYLAMAEKIFEAVRRNPETSPHSFEIFLSHSPKLLRRVVPEELLPNSTSRSAFHWQWIQTVHWKVRTSVEKENENAIDTHPASKPGQIEDTETEIATITMTGGKQIIRIDLIDDQIEDQIERIDRIGAIAAMTADLKDTMIAAMSTAMTEAIELKVTDQRLAILAILAMLAMLAILATPDTLDTLDTLACLSNSSSHRRR